MTEPQKVEIVAREDWTTALSTIAILLFNSLMVMLLMGSIHSRHAAMPAVSYVDAVEGLLVLYAVSVAVRPVRTYRRGGKR